MKKILIGALIASSFAMSGDLAKCSQAIDWQLKYIDLRAEKSNKAMKIRTYMQGEKGEGRKNLEKAASGFEDMVTMFDLLRSEWKKVAQKECRGIVHDDDFGFTEGKQK